ncbi:MAG: sigma-70 family RNA polymerase sigma factor [Planctomycetota bacterium]|nr:sigma-70 family RNA polymerase sigma factor [Planctomycetota bacterium]
MAIRSEELAISIDRWAGPLAAWLRRRCANPDDIVQEAFCRLAQQTRPPERTAPWLFAVAMNLVREEARRTKRRQQRESVVAKTENHNVSASQSLEDAELRNAVDTLSEELREIVIARVWGELTLAEISNITGHSIATTHRRFEQALSQLRNQLSEKRPHSGAHDGTK